MTGLSDILILFANRLDEQSMQAAKTALMDCHKSVLVQQKEGNDRFVLVRFDPRDVTPGLLLGAVQDAGFNAKMAGG